MKPEDKAVIDAAIVLAYESEARTLVDNQPVLVNSEHLRALVQAVIKRRDAYTREVSACPVDPSLQLPAGAMAVEIEAADGGRTTSGRYYALPRNTPQSLGYHPASCSINACGMGRPDVPNECDCGLVLEVVPPAPREHSTSSNTTDEYQCDCERYYAVPRNTTQSLRSQLSRDIGLVK